MSGALILTPFDLCHLHQHSMLVCDGGILTRSDIWHVNVETDADVVADADRFFWSTAFE